MKPSISTLLSISLAALCFGSTSALAGRVKIAGVSASSEYPPDDSGTYVAKKVADGKVSTAWVEGEARNGLGANLTLDLGGEKEVSKVTFWAGMWYSVQYWDYSSRPIQVQLEFSDGSTEMVDIPNEMKPLVYTLKKPVKTSTIKVTLKNVKSGSTFSDTGISEIMVEDTSVDSMPAIASVTASSTAPSDADGSYDPAALVDGMKDTMWCEGNKKSNGTGEWLKFEFASRSSIGALHVNNGIGTSLKYFMKGNRAETVTLEFDDGSKQTVKLANTMMPKAYPISPVTTKSVTIHFDTIKKGTEFDDLCISEAYFTTK